MLSLIDTAGIQNKVSTSSPKLGRLAHHSNRSAACNRVCAEYATGAIVIRAMLFDPVSGRVEKGESGQAIKTRLTGSWDRRILEIHIPDRNRPQPLRKKVKVKSLPGGRTANLGANFDMTC